MNTPHTLLIELIGCAVTGRAMTRRPSAEELEAVQPLAKRHDVAHLVACALSQNKWDEDGRFSNELFSAVMRYENLQYEYERVCNLFEKQAIPFLPLKGAVLRSYYPEPWMRTSCDIDILVRPETLEKGIALLQENGFSLGERGEYDVSLYATSGVHLELHFGIMEEMFASSRMLEAVWQDAKAANGGYRLVMSDDLFYVYHIIHMAKHFEANGCGARFFLDTWVLQNAPAFHLTGGYEALLSQVGLLTFEQTVRQVCAVWFDGAAHTPLTKRMQDFVMHAGIYGTHENRVAFSQRRFGGKEGYARARILPPYASMKKAYPVLEKHKWLLPFCHIKRWCTVLFKGRLGDSVAELKENATHSDIHADTVQALMEDVGLHRDM